MKIIDIELMNRLCADAKTTPRKRTHLNLHETLEDGIHRLCIAAQPGTYMRTHRHRDKWELMIILRGSMVLLTFDENGKVKERLEMSQESGVKAYEIPANCWHTFIINEPDTVLMEVKSGPYFPVPEEDLANWAPAEGMAEAAAFEKWYRQAKPGDCFTVIP